nr:variable surface lipoprotein [Mycoplasmopsis bovis]
MDLSIVEKEGDKLKIKFRFFKWQLKVQAQQFRTKVYEAIIS